MRMCDACANTRAYEVGRAILFALPSDLWWRIERLREEGTTDALAVARQIFRETHSAGSYLLRDVPEELWTAAKHRAVDEGLNLRELIMKALQEYLMKNTP